MSTGTTYLRKDGRWETRVSLGVVDGKRQTKSFYGRTKEEAEGKMMAEVMNGMSFQITGLTVKALCMEWLSVNSHRVKVSTQANYMTKLEKHILPYFGDKMCYEITSKTVYGFIQAKLDEGLSAGYVSNILVLLKTVFKYAQKEYHILNPFDNVIMPKSTKSKTRLLTKKEQKKLKEYLKSNVNTATLGISLAISMGLRIGEICGLTWQDIDFKSRTLTVRRTVQRIRVKGEAKKTKIVILPPKSKSSFREIPIPTSVFAMLKDLRSTPEHYILSDTTEPKEPRMLTYDYVRILKELGLPSVKFHSLRHAAASNAIEAGFDVKTLSEVLGHSRIEMTMNLYVHSNMDRKRKLMDKLDLDT